MTERKVVFLTGPSDLFFFRCGLTALGLPLEDWVVGLAGTAGNIAPDMGMTCSAILPGAEIVPISTRETGALEAFADRFGRHLSLLALSHLFGSFEAEALDLFHREALILTENGIATYLPPKGRTRDASVAPAAPDIAILPLSAHPQLGLPGYLSGLPRLRVVSDIPDDMRTTMAELRARLGLEWVRDLHAAGPAFSVVAGTSLARLRIIDANEERDVYAQILAARVAEGGTVLWKPHPRSGAGNLPPPDVPRGVVEIRGSLPIELYLPDPGDDTGVASGSLHSLASSSLLTAALFHGMAPKVLPGHIDTAAHPHVAAVRALARSAGGS